MPNVALMDSNTTISKSSHNKMGNYAVNLIFKFKVSPRLDYWTKTPKLYLIYIYSK